MSEVRIKFTVRTSVASSFPEKDIKRKEKKEEKKGSCINGTVEITKGRIHSVGQAHNHILCQAETSDSSVCGSAVARFSHFCVRATATVVWIQTNRNGVLPKRRSLGSSAATCWF